MENMLYNLIWTLSLEASFVIFTGSPPSEHIIITMRSQNGPSYMYWLMLYKAMKWNYQWEVFIAAI